MDREQQIGHYPFEKGEASTKVHAEFGRHLSLLLEDPIFAHLNRDKIFLFTLTHFQKAEELFNQEEAERKRGESNANLFYHGKNHAVHQAAYDAVTVMKVFLKESPSAKYITPEGVVATVISAGHHDNGYVYQMPEGTDYAKRQPVHVEESIRSALDIFEEIPVPSGLNSAKIKRLIPIGIHATNFPFTQEHKSERKKMLIDLDPKDKKEALVVALSVQLADLGGQVARPDYKSCLRDLRDELNCVNPGSGDEIIGTDDQVGEKCKWFIDNVVVPTVGKTANAFFANESNTFSTAWQKHI